MFSGFTLDGTVKLIDFGLARIVENATVCNDVYEMSGETGSLRYMAPEVADCQPYNQKADVVSLFERSCKLGTFESQLTSAASCHVSIHLVLSSGSSLHSRSHMTA